jgi:hypothetical protein
MTQLFRRSLDRYDIVGPPGPVEPRFQRAVEAQDHEPRLAGDRLDPVWFLTGGRLRAEPDMGIEYLYCGFAGGPLSSCAFAGLPANVTTAANTAPIISPYRPFICISPLSVSESLIDLPFRNYVLPDSRFGIFSIPHLVSRIQHVRSAFRGRDDPARRRTRGQSRAAPPGVCGPRISQPKRRHSMPRAAFFMPSSSFFTSSGDNCGRSILIVSLLNFAVSGNGGR